MSAADKKFDLIRLATNSLDQAVVATDMGGKVAFVNAAYSRLIGHEAEDVLGRRVTEVLPDFGEFKDQLAKALAQLNTQGAYKDDLLICNQQGEPKWVTMTANVVTDADDQSQYIVATVSDITVTKIHETLQHRLLQYLVEGRSLRSMMTMLCREVQKILGSVHMSVATLDHQGRLWLDAAPDLPKDYCKAINGLPIGPECGSCGTAMSRGEPVYVDDIHSDPLWTPYRHITAKLPYRSVWSTPFSDAVGKAKGVFAFYSAEAIIPTPFHRHIVDICTRLCALAIERSEAQDQVKFLAERDSLTGLYNWQFLQQELKKEIARASRSGRQFALYLIDLDGFKEVNDRCGHQTGDRLLEGVARQIETVANGRDIVARLGGDEFAVLQKDVASREDAMQRAAMLVRAIETATFDDEPASLSACGSVGFALFPSDADSAETMLRNADLALYEAKKIGCGKACSYLIAMTREVEMRRRLEEDLRRALSDGELGLYLAYQPQVRLSDNKLVGFEALVRWNHPELGQISPEVFVPIAERGQLIGCLGEWVLREACKAARRWRDDLYVAVNLSPAQITEGDLPLLVQSVLLDAGLSPSRLELEVTENVLIEDKLRALHILRRLSAMGIRIVMDDFGTGYASLSYLHIFPFDKIKIDRSFISNLELNAYSVAIVDAILGLCSSIGVPVTAEGIETRQQLEILMGKHCDFGQGFYLGYPAEQADLVPREAWGADRLSAVGT